MQLNIYVGPDDEANVRIIRGLAQMGETSTSEIVHQAIAQYLALRFTIIDLNEAALSRGISAPELVKRAMEQYLTMHQEV